MKSTLKVTDRLNAPVQKAWIQVTPEIDIRPFILLSDVLFLFRDPPVMKMY